jgi:uncharacterized protein (TIGR02452 family)
MDRRQRLIDVFEDTQRFYTQNPLLSKAVREAKAAPKLCEAEDYSDISDATEADGSVIVTKHKSFEASLKIHADHPEWKIAVLNFASATNPGGGVKTGSSAQEESLCRCSTLYPTLTQYWLWHCYYQKNRDAHDNLHTDACIYSPGVVICKTDEAWPERMEEKDWVTVDVISCAAPNLRRRPSNAYNSDYGAPATMTSADLYKLHLKRAKHILHIAAANKVDALILGAFGCGAFANDPQVVARAYRDALKDYKRYFQYIEFAVYCRADETENYDAFQRALHV